jgi:hypothetical protein
VKLSSLFKSPQQDAPATALGRDDVPPSGSEVRIRLTIPEDSDSDDLVFEVPSVVEAIRPPKGKDAGPTVLVGAPDLSFVPVLPDFTVEQSLLWTGPASQMELPVLIGDPDQQTWRLLAVGSAKKVQRRQFVRVPMNLPTRITLRLPTGATTLPATILDLSEGGMRCMVVFSPPPEGTRVGVVLTNEDSTIECIGAVVRHLPLGEEGAGPIALAIRFDDPEVHGDVIRRLVFAEQLRGRTNKN